jgi:ribonuclease-3
VHLKDYTFRDILLLELALTHPSAVNNNEKKGNSYERLEFLGDSILSAVIADIIYDKFKEYSEGDLSIILANLVNAKALTTIALELNVAEIMVLDNGEEQCGGRENPKNLENVLEAIIAAIYLDSDFDTVKRIIKKWWAGLFIDVNKLFQKDYKTQLQELVQKKYKILPKYKTESTSGKPHDPLFTMSVSFKKDHKIQSDGKTKKEAQQKAAYAMLEYIKEQDE